ncbi:hypothetical protein [Nocardia transvalensis]|uniref:hypothetical protein n=1 Tax=Nocardia transvalensis TaxID=37333 RepID=UPI001893E37E|nr:hypothetical protein [Nocardia transvalensis]MBF6331610.1 hypothetical protein [Nocardia transvalensis]
MPSRPRDADDVFPADPTDPCAQALALTELATARLTTDPVRAEALLRRALTIGAAALPADQLARLSSLIVTAVAGQPGRDHDLAAAALAAARSWQGLSATDAAHHTLLAARIHFRVGDHRTAAALFRQALSHPGIPYPASEIAVLHEQFGTSLTALHRHRAAAREFTLGARLIADDPTFRELHADLLASAAAARTAARRRALFPRRR